MVDNQQLINESDTGQHLKQPTSPVVHSGVALESNKRYEDRFKKSMSEMCTAVHKYLKDDLLAADAKWNLFIAACQSYRYDSALRPFPPMFIKSDQNKDIDLLLKAVDCVPAFTLLEKILSTSDQLKLNADAINLLYWVLIHLHDPYLKTVPREKFEDVLSLVPCELHAQSPDFVFELKYNEHNTSALKWKTYKHNYRTLYAYHGSRLENFHSIINYGLQLSLTKTTLFGQGIYMSSELLVSLPYSLTGFGWGKSLMGAELSVVALCEILDHPSTHCQPKGTSDKNRAMASDSIAGEVPHKYYVVANSELIRIQYLLVYARTRPVSLNQEPILRPSTVIGWIKDHKLLTAIVGYVFLLASVGLSNNQQVIRYYKMLFSKVGIDH